MKSDFEMTAPITIQTRNLTKYYGKNRGIENLNLEVRKGEIFGFLGPNGAGKTTTIRLLLDLIRKTSGEATIFGYDTQKDSQKIREHVAYIPGELGFYKDWTIDTPIPFQALQSRCQVGGRRGTRTSL